MIIIYLLLLISLLIIVFIIKTFYINSLNNIYNKLCPYLKNILFNKQYYTEPITIVATSLPQNRTTNKTQFIKPILLIGKYEKKNIIKKIITFFKRTKLTKVNTINNNISTVSNIIVQAQPIEQDNITYEQDDNTYEQDDNTYEQEIIFTQLTQSAYVIGNINFI